MQIISVIAEIVVPVCHDQQVEWPVSVYESIDQLHGQARVNVIICIPGDEQQLAGQVSCLSGGYLLCIIR
jgi:hypothetical protein